MKWTNIITIASSAFIFLFAITASSTRIKYEENNKGRDDDLVHRQLFPLLTGGSTLNQYSDPKSSYLRSNAQTTDPCDNILLLITHKYANNGLGSQLNSYILTVIEAIYMGRALVVVDPPMNTIFHKYRPHHGGSQFGCPSDSFRSKRKFKADFPQGLSRVLDHPEWLSHNCPIPCQTTHKYLDWHNLSDKHDFKRVENRATGKRIFIDESKAPHDITCTNDNGRKTNVLVVNGFSTRGYFINHFKRRILQRPSPTAHDFAIRLGAKPHEAQLFAALTEPREIYDYIAALLNRSGALRFQPWILRDVERFFDDISLPVDEPHDGIHVRRGDKLAEDAKPEVTKYWDTRGENGRNANHPMYMPFVHYLRQYNNETECGIRRVYVATDDPQTVKKEMSQLPRENDGTIIINECLRLKLFFNGKEKRFHVTRGYRKKCDTVYESTIAAFSDMMILAASDTFVGEFNSNWGRVVRFLRTFMSDDGQRAVVKDTRIAWGTLDPGDLGF